MTSFNRRTSLSLLLLVLLFAHSRSQESIQTNGTAQQAAAIRSEFTWLPPDAIPNAVSPDGSVVVGSINGVGAFRWDDKSGLVILPPLRSDFLPTGTSATGVSNDGMTIVGSSVYDTITVAGGRKEWLIHAVRWSASGGVTKLPSIAGHLVSYAAAVDASGNTIAGVVCSTFAVNSPYPGVPYLGQTPRGATWTGGTVSHLPGVHAISYAYGISPDGSVVVGSSQPSASTGAQQATKWDGTGLVSLGFTWPPYSKAICASTSGNVVTAQQNNPIPTWSYKITTAGRLSLGAKTTPNAITPDGSRIVGQQTKTVWPDAAVIWNAGSTTLQDLKLFLQSSYGISLPNCSLIDARGISADGNVIVGYGYDSLSFMRGFRVVLKAGPITVWKPTKGALWLAGTTETIRWTCYNKTDSVNVFFSTDNGATQRLIAGGIRGDSGSLSWKMPKDVMSAKCIIKIVSTSRPDSAQSELFKVKGTYLTRYNAAGQYEAFAQPRDQFSFGNEEPLMWPNAWWQQFNYQFWNDPSTGFVYPQDTKFPFKAAASSDFPDWPNFVQAFGVNQCYWTPTPTGYKNIAMTKWKSIKGAWGGSCFGIAVTSLMAFDDKARFLAAFPQVGVYDSLFAVAGTDNVRRLVNEIYIHQFGATHDAYASSRMKTITPTQTIQELRKGFLNDLREDATLDIYKQTGSPAGHSIVAYKLEQDAINPNFYWISVYDNSYNTDYAARIKVDTVADTWDYSNWPGWGGSKGLVISDPVSGYYVHDALKRAASPGSFPAYVPRQQRMVAATSWEVYSSTGSSVVISDPEGKRIGFQNDASLNEIPDASPIIPLNSRVAPPIGYHLPPGSYSITMGNALDSTISFSLLSDSSVMTYERSGITSPQTDQLGVADSRTMRMTNSDPQSKHIDLNIVVEEPTAEKIFRVQNVDVPQGDSLTVAAVTQDQFKISHTGSAPTNCDVRIEHNSGSGLRVFSNAGFAIEGNSGYVFVPKWNTFATDTSLQILVDHGNDGTIDDTLSLRNTYTGVGDHGSLLPGEFRLEQNFPNPFNPQTVIGYWLLVAGKADLRVYDVLGREVAVLVNEAKPAGRYAVTWNAQGMASGIYFYQMRAGGKVFTRKMILLR